MRWLNLAIALLIVTDAASALAVVYARHDNRSTFVQLQKLESQRDALEVEWGQLQLEQSTWAGNSRVEQLAREKLDMVIPAERDIVVLKHE